MTCKMYESRYFMYEGLGYRVTLNLLIPALTAGRLNPSLKKEGLLKPKIIMLSLHFIYLFIHSPFNVLIYNFQ